MLHNFIDSCRSRLLLTFVYETWLKEENANKIIYFVSSIVCTDYFMLTDTTI